MKTTERCNITLPKGLKALALEHNIQISVLVSLVLKRELAKRGVFYAGREKHRPRKMVRTEA